eukprot:TRINITY_DN10146_c0_g1_i3.p1 TRINITY_DN10146_c0_g1~~TRINITY_DN10146_c0_g1_i3.p1  ORF type:complete len:276 (-),score=44.05 TRINITY_DN10146_c0_g1_i3:101-928(-)
MKTVEHTCPDIITLHGVSRGRVLISFGTHIQFLDLLNEAMLWQVQDEISDDVSDASICGSWIAYINASHHARIRSSQTGELIHHVEGYFIEVIATHSLILLATDRQIAVHEASDLSPIILIEFPEIITFAGNMMFEDILWVFCETELFKLDFTMRSACGIDLDSPNHTPYLCAASKEHSYPFIPTSDPKIRLVMSDHQASMRLGDEFFHPIPRCYSTMNRNSILSMSIVVDSKSSVWKEEWEDGEWKIRDIAPSELRMLFPDHKTLLSMIDQLHQ